MAVTFEWDSAKADANLEKHGVSFSEAQLAFLDASRVVARDMRHSHTEQRYYCLGMVGPGVLTVRFTYRSGVIRIIGAGYWRKGKKLYDAQNKIHR
jgi:uncharacterized DUF497 family protein